MMSQAPVYMGGDATNPPFMSVNKPPTILSEQPVSFFTGEDDYMFTRRVALWNGQNYVTVARADYTDIQTLEHGFINPWAEPVTFTGTDGMQFHPLIEESETLSAFTNEIARHGYFNFKSSETSTYDGLTLMTFQVRSQDMDNSTANPDNAIFNTGITGTANMTSVLRAPVLASKGHFLQVPDIMANVTATIINHAKNVITPDENRDDIFIGVEQMSGVSAAAKQRVQYNFHVVQDNLFNYTTNDFLIPLTFVQREAVITPTQIKDLLAALYSAKVAKTAGICVLVIVGVLLIILGVLLLINFKKTKRQEDLGIIPGGEATGGYDQDRLESLNRSDQKSPLTKY
jgi:hypothetical protein